MDVRIDRFFRLFDNHKYPHIDPAQPQEDLTRLVEVAPDEPFILHPVSLYWVYAEKATCLMMWLPVRGVSSLGRLGLLTTHGWFY